MEAISPPVRSNESVTGLFVIHSAPLALKPHIEWAIQSILGTWVTISWKSQSLAPGTYRTSLDFRGKSGLAATIASSLASWRYLRFEVREENLRGGEFYRFTPDLGMHRAVIDASGSVMITENQIADAMAASFDEDSLRESLERAIGNQWDVELELFRGVELREVARLHAM